MSVLDLSSTNLLDGYQGPDSGVTWYQFINGVAKNVLVGKIFLESDIILAMKAN
jgi:hypothetical protein